MIDRIQLRVEGEGKHFLKGRVAEHTRPVCETSHIHGKYLLIGADLTRMTGTIHLDLDVPEICMLEDQDCVERAYCGLSVDLALQANSFFLEDLLLTEPYDYVRLVEQSRLRLELHLHHSRLLHNQRGAPVGGKDRSLRVGS